MDSKNSAAKTLLNSSEYLADWLALHNTQYLEINVANVSLYCKFI